MQCPERAMPPQCVPVCVRIQMALERIDRRTLRGARARRGSHRSLSSNVTRKQFVYRRVFRMVDCGSSRHHSSNCILVQTLENYGTYKIAPPDLPFLNFCKFWKKSKMYFDVFGRFSKLIELSVSAVACT